MRYRRIEISVERIRVFAANRRETISTDWCERCGEQVQMVTLDEATIIKGMSSRHIHRLIEAGELHFAEIENGFHSHLLKLTSRPQERI